MSFDLSVAKITGGVVVVRIPPEGCDGLASVAFFGDTTVPYAFVRDTHWSEETTMQGDPVSKDSIHTHNEKDIRRLPLCHSGDEPPGSVRSEFADFPC